MRFWKRNYSVCKTCGVHFEPVTGYQARWGDYCAVHRTEPRKKDERRETVMAWAAANIDRLYEQMQAERAQEKQARQRARVDEINRQMNAMGAHAATQAQAQAASGQRMSGQLWPQGGGIPGSWFNKP